MFVYRKQETETTPGECLSRLSSILEEMLAEPAHERATELLIEFGEFEAGVADALSPERDTRSPALSELRRAALSTGHIFYRSWLRESSDGVAEPIPRELLWRLGRAMDKFQGLPLPKTIRTSVPEGYAHYGLFPETYAIAAGRFFDDFAPGRAVCIGVRSIGSSLSAVVSASLEERGCRINSYTVRPRGHPFHRELKLSPEFEEEFRLLRGGFFLIIDEGPGLSGSTICSVARGLERLGISEERIILFPSWTPDGNNFISGEAKDIWQRLKKYCSPFEGAWIKTGLLERQFDRGPLHDISAGGWRSLLCGRDMPFPAVHPNHEKRKYICGEGNEYLLKFAGLGSYGKRYMQRAIALAEAGFMPEPLGLKNGFVMRAFVEGKPLKQPGPGLLARAAQYLDYLRRNHPAPTDMSFHEASWLLNENVSEGLGPKWAGKLARIEKQFKRVLEESTATKIDGRMFLHEWIQAEQGALYKTDGVAHHADQFFPRCQDIAWDISGAICEFIGPGQRQDYFVEKYQSISNDRHIRRRLPYYIVMYLAYRLGYAMLALGELGATPEGGRFSKLARRYGRWLKEEIIRLCGE
jgi:hypothetical protein